MKEEQVNITDDYRGDFTEIAGIPTVNGKRMGLFARKRFNYWRDTNADFVAKIRKHEFDVSAEYIVSKNENNSCKTKSYSDYIMGGGKCYGGNVGDRVSFRLVVHGDGKNPEVRIRKLQMTCSDEHGNVSFEMLFGGFDYDNSLDDFFNDFVENPSYSLKK